MKLSLIAEGSAKKIRPTLGSERYQQIKKSLGFMPAKKVKHSLRVGATTAQAGLGAEEVEAALLHDYIERGGDLQELEQLDISPRGMRILQMLTMVDKSPGSSDSVSVYDHIKDILDDSSIDEHDKNIVIVVKCADRIDNLKKRIRLGKLSKSYRASSYRLFDLLFSRYTGDPEVLDHIKRKIAKLKVK